jgi:DNA-binding NarL/FixJ family response regulator
VRVVIADDAVLFRVGLARVLEAAGVEVAAQVGDASTCPAPPTTTAASSPSLLSCERSRAIGCR